MNKKLLIVCLLGSFITVPIVADDPIDSVTMEIAKDNRDGKRLGIPIREIIVQYMLDNGDITQEELDEQKANRQESKLRLSVTTIMSVTPYIIEESR